MLNGRTANWRKRQESNLPGTPSRPPTVLKTARPTGDDTLPSPINKIGYAEGDANVNRTGCRLGPNLDPSSSCAESRVKRRDSTVFLTLDQMGIGVQRDRRQRVTEPPRDRQNVDPTGDQSGRVRMPQGMEPDPWQLPPADKVPPTVAQRIRRPCDELRACRPREHVISGTGAA